MSLGSAATKLLDIKERLLGAPAAPALAEETKP
jgi:hypothetical protein